MKNTSITDYFHPQVEKKSTCTCNLTIHLNTFEEKSQFVLVFARTMLETRQQMMSKLFAKIQTFWLFRRQKFYFFQLKCKIIMLCFLPAQQLI